MESSKQTTAIFALMKTNIQSFAARCEKQNVKEVLYAVWEQTHALAGRDLPDQALQFSNFYVGEWPLERFELTEQLCYLSGHRLSRKIMRHPFQSRAKFYTYICPMCGTIFEAPDERVALYLQGADVFEVGDPCNQQVIIENRSADTLWGYVALAFWDKGFELQIEPGLLPIQLASHERVSTAFTIRYNAQLIQAHVHRLRAVFVSNLSIYHTERLIYFERRRGSLERTHANGTV